MSDPTPTVLLLSDDLMFLSRVREALRPLGWPLRQAAADFDTAFALRPNVVLVNLSARRFDPLDAVVRAKGAGLSVIAFAGHVEVQKHADARAAGADLVAANSSVALHLPALLRQVGLPA